MKEKMYSLALRKKGNIHDHFWMHNDYEFQECFIDCGGRYWLADPFLYEKDDETYLFYEAFDLVEQKGKIGYSKRLSDGVWTPPKILIDERFHMSFPYIFNYGDVIYMMPETCEDFSIRLYKAVSFPEEWERATLVLPQTYACDSVLIDTNYILACEMYHKAPNGHYASCWVKNRIYPLEQLEATGKGVTVAEGDFGIRNAGKPFSEGNMIYRIGQDCRDNLYGRGLVLYKIDSLEPYSETMIWDIDCHKISPHIQCSDHSSIIGVHTYNFSEKFEVIDFSQIKELSMSIVMRRHLRGLSFRMKKILNHVFK